MAESDKSPGADSYALRSDEVADEMDLPELDYLPARPRNYQPKIGLIGCGGITEEHLTAYQAAGYEVVALTDLDEQRARERRDKFYPDATVCQSSAEVLAREDINIVDIATHPKARATLVEQALLANKHVLSQKPFVTDLEIGRRLCQLAQERNLKLAVNQNGRWAPWVSWIRKAVESQLIGDVASVDTMICWDHTWVRGTPFERIPHLILYDFAIHWFDMLHCYTRGQTASFVSAQVMKAPHQDIAPPLLAQVSVQLEHSQATLTFRANSQWGPINQTHITGSKGTIRSQGPGLDDQTVVVHTEQGQGSPDLAGSWFPGGFDGTMSELIVAIEEDREPYHSGADNLSVLEMCFAAIKSAETGAAVPVGEVQRLEKQWIEAE